MEALQIEHHDICPRWNLRVPYDRLRVEVHLNRVRTAARTALKCALAMNVRQRAGAAEHQLTDVGLDCRAQDLRANKLKDERTWMRIYRSGTRIRSTKDQWGVRLKCVLDECRAGAREYSGEATRKVRLEERPPTRTCLAGEEGVEA